MRRMKSTQLNWRGGDLEAMQLTEYCLQRTLAHAFPKSNMHWVIQKRVKKCILNNSAIQIFYMILIMIICRACYTLHQSLYSVWLFSAKKKQRDKWTSLGKSKKYKTKYIFNVDLPRCCRCVSQKPRAKFNHYYQIWRAFCQRSIIASANSELSQGCECSSVHSGHGQVQHLLLKPPR